MMIRHRRLRTVSPAVDPTPSDLGPVAEPVAADTSNEQQWLDRAWRALSRGDYRLAAYAAGMSREHKETAQSALILARAAAGLDLFEEAIVEAQRAVRLAPDEPENHLALAGIFVDLGNRQAALRCYQTAERLVPNSSEARIGQALVLSQSGNISSAERLLESMFASGSERHTVADCLGLVLIEAAERIPRMRIGETYVITSPQEIAAMRAKLARAEEVAQDLDLLACIAELRAYVETCARRTWVSGRLLRGRTGWTYLPVLAVLGFGMTAFQSTGSWTVMLLLSASLLVGSAAHDLLVHTWVPRWKLNRFACDREKGAR